MLAFFMLASVGMATSSEDNVFDVELTDNQEVTITLAGEDEDKEGILFLCAGKQTEDGIELLRPEKISVGTSILDFEQVIIKDDFEGSYSFPARNLEGSGNIYIFLYQNDQDILMARMPYSAEDGISLGEIQTMGKMNCLEGLYSDNMDIYFPGQTVVGLGNWMYLANGREIEDAAVAAFIVDSERGEVVEFRDDALTLGLHEKYTLCEDFDGACPLFEIGELPSENRGYVFGVVMDEEGMQTGIMSWEYLQDMGAWRTESYFSSDVI